MLSHLPGFAECFIDIEQNNRVLDGTILERGIYLRREVQVS